MLTASVPASTGAYSPASPSPALAIEGTAYDTAWLAGVPLEEDRRRSRFPTALQWLVEHQHLDGSWGGAVRYEHDRILSTLAALAPLATYGRRATDRTAVAAGTRYLWRHGHRLAHDPVELVGFELLLPALVERARRAGIAVPPHLDIYGRQRAEKLRLLPPGALYSPGVTVVHSLEFLGDEADLAGLRAARGENGSLGNSPAATAFYYERSGDERALAYLRECLVGTGGAMAPVLHPCETFELLWSAYHLALAGLPARQLLPPGAIVALGDELGRGGVSLSPTFPIADADNTAVALLLLHDCGLPVDPTVLRRFALEDRGFFASFPYERHPSVGVNAHVLHALLRVPGYPDLDRTIGRLLDHFAAAQAGGLYWVDKWHISPYYATAHVLAALAELPPRWADRAEALAAPAREWVRQTQHDDGSWGFYDRPTAEETAYGVLALSCGGRDADAGAADADRRRCARAVAHLRALPAQGEGEEWSHPSLWIDKCLYTPTLVVRAAIEGALVAGEW